MYGSFREEAKFLLSEIDQRDHRKVLRYLQALAFSPDRQFNKHSSTRRESWIRSIEKFDEYIKEYGEYMDAIEHRKDIFVQLFADNYDTSYHNDDVRSAVIDKVLTSEVCERYTFSSQILVYTILEGCDKSVKVLLRAEYDEDDLTDVLPLILHFKKTILVCLEDPRFHRRKDLMKVIKSLERSHIAKNERAYCRKIAKKIASILSLQPKYDLDTCPWYEVISAFQ